MSKKLLLRTLSVALGCLSSVLVAEIGLRMSNIWIGRHSDTMFTIIEHDGALGWRMKPNIAARIDVVDLEGLPVRSNSEGFWDKEFVLQKPPNRTRIVFLGDSFTWGFGVREEERFTNRLASANPQWDTLNFGMPGYGTDQSLLVWRHLSRRYQPDLVIMTVFDNDYVDNVSVMRSGRRKPYFELTEGNQLELKNVPVDDTNFWDDGTFNQIALPYTRLFSESVQKRSRVAHWLAKNSNLARLIYTVVRSRSAQTDAEEQPFSPNRKESSDRSAKISGESELNGRQQVEVRLLEAIVEELAREVKAAGARFAVVLVGPPSRMYEAQKEMFNRAGVLWLDATTEVISNNLSNGARVYYPYSKHWTPEANRVVADLLNRFIHERVLMDSTINVPNSLP